MNSKGVIFLLSLCSVCVSLNDQNACEQYSKGCEMHRLRATIDSSVLLPCDLRRSNITSVSWAQNSEGDLVVLSSEGRIQFPNPRHGRVKAFPNQGSEGNFSIRIDKLKDSDLGCYLCKWEKNCIQVTLAGDEGTLNLTLLIYACVSGAVFLLICIGCYFCVKHKCNCHKTLQDSTDNSAAAEVVASAPPAGRGRVHVQQRGIYINDLVYENDDHDPANQHEKNRNQCPPAAALPDPEMAQPSQSTSGIHPNSDQFKFVRMENQSTKRRFHTELFNRLRQASFSQRYYVNQRELSNQQAAQAEHPKRGLGKGGVKENCEYKNPIYNRSTDRLNQM
ncbi:uncharacterized protein LOC117825584 [Xyrichtys novacula]|uniref:Uncharacterized protein LOC117825584 n=1 Tax=Xyrichtys novacula TaxID=13765 RepID=A0AAV1FYR3_XYRNO|nr:uncharacterized protein LOC117825584 [Xyrichtys novacula]